MDQKFRGHPGLPSSVWSSQDRQHGEAGPGGQSPRKSLLLALGVTAGQKKAHSSGRYPSPGALSAAEYLTTCGISEAVKRRTRVKSSLPLTFSCLYQL